MKFFSNGNQIVHTYDAMGNRLRTTYYTRKVALVEPATNTIPGTDNLQEYNIVSYTMLGNTRYKRYDHSDWNLDIIKNTEGFMKYFTPPEERYPYYYVKDHLGNVREAWIRPYPNEKYLEQRMQYYPSGLPWNANLFPGNQPFKYGGKEFIEMHGLDVKRSSRTQKHPVDGLGSKCGARVRRRPNIEHLNDSKARWYYPAIMRTTTMDPKCEDYYSISPYAWCGNNPVNYIDPDGRYYNQETEETAKRMEELLQKRIREVIDNRDKCAIGSKEFANYTIQVKELQLSLQDFSDMRNDKNYEYRFSEGSSSFTKCEEVNYQLYPVVEMTFENDELAIHEGRHGGQNARREIVYFSNGTVFKYGVSSEVSAYRAQVAYAGSLQTQLQLTYNNGIPYVQSVTISKPDEVTPGIINAMIDKTINNKIYPPTNYDPTIWRIF